MAGSDWRALTFSLLHVNIQFKYVQREHITILLARFKKVPSSQQNVFFLTSFILQNLIVTRSKEKTGPPTSDFCKNQTQIF